MKTSWWIGIVFVFVVAHLACSTVGGDPTGVDMATLQGIFSVEGMDYSNPLTAVWSAIVLPLQWIWTVLGMLFFTGDPYDNVFYGDYIWFRTLFLWPLSVAVIISTWLAVVRGTSST